jgi:hypothetical protein
MDINDIKKIAKIVKLNSNRGVYNFDFNNKKLSIYKKRNYDIIDFKDLKNTNDTTINYAILTIDNAKKVNWHDINSILDFKNYINNANIFYCIFELYIEHIDKNLLDDYDFICKLYEINKEILKYLSLDLIKKFILDNYIDAFNILEWQLYGDIKIKIMNDIGFMTELIKLDFNYIKDIAEYHFSDELHSHCGCNECNEWL